MKQAFPELFIILTNTYALPRKIDQAILSIEDGQIFVHG